MESPECPTWAQPQIFFQWSGKQNTSLSQAEGCPYEPLRGMKRAEQRGCPQPPSPPALTLTGCRWGPGGGRVTALGTPGEQQETPSWAPCSLPEVLSLGKSAVRSRAPSQGTAGDSLTHECGRNLPGSLQPALALGLGGDSRLPLPPQADGTLDACRVTSRGSSWAGAPEPSLGCLPGAPRPLLPATSGAGGQAGSS